MEVNLYSRNYIQPKILSKKSWGSLICLVARMAIGVRSMQIGSFGWGDLMLQDPKPPVNPKETSLITHPDASIRMYHISAWSTCMLQFMVINFSFSYQPFLPIFFQQVCQGDWNLPSPFRFDWASSDWWPSTLAIKISNWEHRLCWLHQGFPYWPCPTWPEHICGWEGHSTWLCSKEKLLYFFPL